LKNLYLQDNKISDISILDKVNMKHLKNLDLKDNNIDLDKYSSIIDKLLLIKDFNI